MKNISGDDKSKNYLKLRDRKRQEMKTISEREVELQRIKIRFSEGYKYPKKLGT